MIVPVIRSGGEQNKNKLKGRNDIAFYFEEPPRMLGEYPLTPGYSFTRCIPSQMSLKTPLVKHKKGTEPDITINISMVSIIVQSASDDRMAIALAQEGGVSFTYGSQVIEKQAEVIRKAK